jgi:hypothetical protein
VESSVRAVGGAMSGDVEVSDENLGGDRLLDLM